MAKNILKFTDRITKVFSNEPHTHIHDGVIHLTQIAQFHAVLQRETERML